MPKNPPENVQRLIPGLSYADAPAAIDFLCRAFGFEEAMRFPMPDGRIGHAALTYAGQEVVTLASEYEELGFKSPRELPAVSINLYCYVDDVDKHYEQAKAVGAEIVSEPEDQFYGDRSYRTKDLEGHFWTFATRVRDVAPEDMKPPEQNPVLARAPSHARVRAAYHEEDVVALANLLGPSQVLFGSDFPHPEGLAEPADFAATLEGLDDAARRDIMGGNLQRLLEGRFD